MKKVLILAVFSWIVFAVTDITASRDVFRAYTASEVKDYNPADGLPRLRPRAVTDYRIQNDKVLSRTGNYLNEFENCKVFDLENWVCNFSDESGSFGVKQGEFYSRTNTENFPQIKYLGDDIALTRFRYIVLQCRWDATGGFNAIMCLLRPFTT